MVEEGDPFTWQGQSAGLQGLWLVILPLRPTHRLKPGSRAPSRPGGPPLKRMGLCPGSWGA